MRRSAPPFVFLVLAFSLAGSSVVPGKILSGLPPFATAAGSAAIGLAVLLPLAAREKRPGRGEVRRALPLLAAQAFFGIALFRVLLFAALARTGAAEVGMATSVTPAATALLAALFLRERVRPRVAIGIAAVVAGVALLESGGGGATGTDPASRLPGLALAVGAAVSESVFNVMAKRLPSSLGPRRTSAAVTGIALALLAILSLATGERIDVAELGTPAVAALAYYGAFASALAYLCWYRGIASVPASTAGAFSGLMPLTGFVLSILAFGDRPGALGALGATLSLAGMTLCAMPRATSPLLTFPRFAAIVAAWRALRARREREG